MINILFVYGTLRPEAQCAMGRDARTRLQSESRLCGSARTQGTLYNLGNYPGLGHGLEWIAGSLYQLNDPSNTLKWLDEYEGITGAIADEYERVLKPILLHDGQSVQAWVYLLTQARVSTQIIRSGDWLNR